MRKTKDTQDWAPTIAKLKQGLEEAGYELGEFRGATNNRFHLMDGAIRERMKQEMTYTMYSINGNKLEHIKPIDFHIKDLLCALFKHLEISPEKQVIEPETKITFSPRTTEPCDTTT